MGAGRSTVALRPVRSQPSLSVSGGATPLKSGESLDALVSDETIRSYDREDGAVTLKVAARSAGQVFTARYRAVPTLAGRVSARFN